MGDPIEFLRVFYEATDKNSIKFNWLAIYEMCAIIKQQNILPRSVFSALKTRFENAKDPMIRMKTLMVSEILVEICPLLHEELLKGTSRLLPSLYDFVKMSPLNIRNRILELLQKWSHLFENVPEFKNLHLIVKTLEEEYDFTSLDAKEDSNSSILIYREFCRNCKIQYNVICGYCGHLFCGKCECKSFDLHHFGFEKEVAVCDICYNKLYDESLRKIRKNIFDQEVATRSRYLMEYPRGIKKMKSRRFTILNGIFLVIFLILIGTSIFFH